MAERILVITGPTASGKSAVALEVARQLGGEIVSLDSRQVYRGMDIGTAKPSAAERQAVPHHGLDLVNPDERYSAGRFAREARGWIAAIAGRGGVPILAGGTGFFLRALTSPLFTEPPLEPARRERLKRWLTAQPTESLRRWVGIVEQAGSAGRGDPQRLARRIEVALLTGRPLSWWQANSAATEARLSSLVFLLELPRPELYRRIDARVLAMLAQGLVEEVRGLLRRGYGGDDPGMKATGYIEVLAHLAGEYSLERAAELIQNATRRFARRQLTWFRNQLAPGYIRVDATQPAAAMASRILAEWGRAEH